MKAPEISVVMPVYNTGNILGESIESVLDQTFEDFEYLIVDDGSTDAATEKILAGQSDPRVRVIRQSNGGVAAARNRGIAESRGKYIAFLDHDDIFMPDKLFCLKKLLDHDPAAAFAYSPVEPFGKYAVRALVLAPLSGRSYSRLLQQNRVYSMSCVMVRAELLRRHRIAFDPACVPCDDWDFCLHCAMYGTIRRWETPLVRYRMYDGNQSADQPVMYRAGIRVVRKHLRNISRIAEITGLARRSIFTAGCRALAEHHYGLAYQDFSGRRFQSALVNGVSAFLCNPCSGGRLISFAWKKIRSALHRPGADGGKYVRNSNMKG